MNPLAIAESFGLPHPPPMPPPEPVRSRLLERYAVLDSAPEQPYEDIALLASIVCDVPLAAIALVDDERVWFKARRGFELTQLPHELSLCPLAMASGEPVFEVPDLRDDPRCTLQARFIGGRLPFYASVPIHSGDGQPLGTLCVLDTAPRTLTVTQRAGLVALGRQAQHLLDMRMRQREERARFARQEASVRQNEADREALHARMEELRRTASYDALTQLFNRAALNPLLEDAHVALETMGERYSLMIVDVDHFKQVNDSVGHLAGDDVLTGVARAITRTIREDDIAGRYGGDEFVVVLPNASLAAGMQVAERIRIRIASEVIAGSGPVTVSIGVAQRDADEHPAQVFQRADAALYRAKEAGRACVSGDGRLRSDA